MDKAKEITDTDLVLDHYTDLMRQKLHKYVENHPDDLDSISWRDCTVDNLHLLLSKAYQEQDYVSVGNYALFLYARQVLFGDLIGEA